MLKNTLVFFALGPLVGTSLHQYQIQSHQRARVKAQNTAFSTLKDKVAVFPESITPGFEASSLLNILWQIEKILNDKYVRAT